MRTYLPYSAGLVLGTLQAVSGQADDPFSQFVSQALSVYTGVVSALSVQATATDPSTTSSSTSSTISTISTSTSTSSSTLATSTRVITSTRPPSNTAEAAAASSSAAAAAAAMNAQNTRNRTIAIVLGVVLGLLALALIIGLILFCLRRRRRKRAVGSKRSVSPDAVGGASWGKEPLSSTSTAGYTIPGRLSTHEPHRTPIVAATPPMAANTLHNHDGHGALGSSALTPHRGAPNFQSGTMDGYQVGHGPQRPSPNHIPLSSHSRSNLAAAGLGGAALGGLAASHHHDKHDERNYEPHPDEHRRSISRKPIAGAHDHRPTGPTPGIGHSNDSVPGYQEHHSSLPHGHTGPSSDSPGTTGGIHSTPSPRNGNPPAYNTSSHPLSSHPPFADSTNRHNTGPSPLAAGAAGALGGAALAHHHHDHDHDHDPRHGNEREPDSSLTGRRSWDPNRQRRSPQSILANASNRRSTGSTNPYVQPRSPGRRARFSDDVPSGSNSPARERGGSGGYADEMPQHPQAHSSSPYPGMEHSHSPQQIQTQMPPDSFEPPRNSSSSPRSAVPSGWRGSGEFDRNGNSNNATFGNDTINTTPHARNVDSKSPTLSDLRRQEEEEGWYRGRYMGDDVRPVSGAESGPVPGLGAGAGGVDPGKTGDMVPQEQRFYANVNKGGAGVGQAM